MGKNGFTQEEVIELKKTEQGGTRSGCGRWLIFIGLALIIGGLFFADAMQGKTLRPNPTPIGGETAVSQLATPTLAPSATVTPLPTDTATAVPTQTPSATAQPTQTPWPTDTPIPTSTPLPTNTPYPTHTPQATWTAEPTHTAQPTYTPYPTATETGTVVPSVATDVPFLAPVVIEADPPNGDALPAWLPWLVGSLVFLLLVALVVLAYVSRQMRPPTPVLITPEGVPVGTAPHGRQLPPPDGQPVRETSNAPVHAPVTPVTPLGEPEAAPVQTGQGAAPPEKIEVSVSDANPDTDEATMQAICAAWNEIVERSERPSLNKLCTEYFGGKNSERMAIARRALKWGRANGLIGNKNQKEVKTDEPENRPEPTAQDQRPRRRPIPIISRRGRSVFN